MSEKGLDLQTSELINKVFIKYSCIEKAVLFGSRAKGSARNNSDIDIAIFGTSKELEIEAIASQLDDLPLPNKFDVKAFDRINNIALREHIERVGICIYKKIEKNC
jgi:predicted nucleotidyltransferase